VEDIDPEPWRIHFTYIYRLCTFMMVEDRCSDKPYITGSNQSIELAYVDRSIKSLHHYVNQNCKYMLIA